MQIIKISFLLTIIFAAISGSEICCAQSDYVEDSFVNYDQLEDDEYSSVNREQPEGLKHMFAKMQAETKKMQAKTAKIEANTRAIELETRAMELKMMQAETAKLEAKSRAAEFEAEMSAIQVELEVMPVETEVMPREMDVETAEKLFRRCLINNRHSFALGRSGIPKVCEDLARVLRLLGGRSEADELIEAFKQ